ncbi:WD40 domain-containing protein, partial [Cephalotus follicularis]
GNCVYGDAGCRYLHSWFDGKDFSMLARLEGHKKALTGITFPSGSDKLYNGGKDGKLRIWDCNSGQCVKFFNLGDQIGCLISEGSWVFMGLPNVVKAWNASNTEAVFEPFCLEGPVGQVYALAVANGNMLFAGAEDGAILAWRASCETNPFELVASLDGHTMAVVCLTVGANKLFSGSKDHTIRIWDIETLKCTHTLKGHTDAVMSIIGWDHYLMTCSLDKTIKVWAAETEGTVRVIYTHNEEHGVNALCTTCDAEAKQVLLCSCKDDSVRLYELPSFKQRGRLFSNREIGVIQFGPGGLFFTGDGLGVLSVWNWLPKPDSGAS